MRTETPVFRERAADGSSLAPVLQHLNDMSSLDFVAVITAGIPSLWNTGSLWSAADHLLAPQGFIVEVFSEVNYSIRFWAKSIQLPSYVGELDEKAGRGCFRGCVCFGKPWRWEIFLVTYCKMWANAQRLYHIYNTALVHLAKQLCLRPMGILWLNCRITGLLNMWMKTEAHSCNSDQICFCFVFAEYDSCWGSLFPNPSESFTDVGWKVEKRLAWVSNEALPCVLGSSQPAQPVMGPDIL